MHLEDICLFSALSISLYIIQKYGMPVLISSLKNRKFAIIKKNITLKRNKEIAISTLQEVNKKHQATLFKRENWLEEAPNKLEVHLKNMRSEYEFHMQEIRKHYLMHKMIKERKTSQTIYNNLFSTLQKDIQAQASNSFIHNIK